MAGLKQIDLHCQRESSDRIEVTQDMALVKALEGEASGKLVSVNQDSQEYLSARPYKVTCSIDPS